MMYKFDATKTEELEQYMNTLADRQNSLYTKSKDELSKAEKQEFYENALIIDSISAFFDVFI